jgi:hypothetical protein
MLFSINFARILKCAPEQAAVLITKMAATLKNPHWFYMFLSETGVIYVA